MILGFRWAFQNEDNQRSWREQFYWDAGDSGSPTSENTVNFMARIATARARALVRSNTIVDVTVYPADNPRLTTITQLNRRGTLPANVGDEFPPDQDIAPASVLLQLSGTLGRRQYLMRGIADDDIKSSNFVPVGNRRGAYTTWFSYLNNSPLMIRYSIFGPSRTILEVSGSGTITLGAPAGVVPAGTLIDINTTVAGGGPSVRTRAKTRVASDPLEPTLYVYWSRGNCTQGIARTVTYGYTPINVYAQRIPARTRKTGGPLGKFRGRR